MIRTSDLQLTMQALYLLSYMYKDCLKQETATHLPSDNKILPISWQMSPQSGNEYRQVGLKGFSTPIFGI